MKLLFFLFLFFFSCILSLQSKAAIDTDSLIIALQQTQKSQEQLHILHQLTKELAKSDFETCTTYCRKALDIADNDNNIVFTSLIYSNWADAYYYKYEFDKALQYYKKSLIVAGKISNDSLQASANNNIGIIHYLWGNLDIAKDFFNKAIEQSKNSNDIDGLANSLNNIGNIFLDQSRVDTALFIYDKVLEIKRKYGKLADVASCMNNIGTALEMRGENKKALDYFEQAVQITEETGDKRSIASSNVNIGLIYQSWGQYQKSLAYMQKAMLDYEEINDMGGIATTHNNIGLIYNQTGDYKLALKNYQNALRIQLKIGDKSGIAASYYNIGVLLDNIKEFKNALVYYRKSLQLKQQLQDINGISNIYSSLGNTYGSIERIDSALLYYNKALQIKRQLDDQEGIATLYQNIGAILDYTGKYNKAVEYYEKSLEIARRLNNTESIALSLQNLGSNHKNRSQLNQALKYYNECEQIAIQANLRLILMNNYKFISEIHMLSDNYKKALDNFMNYTALKDSIFGEEEKNQLREIHTKYETEAKEREIQILKKDKELSNVKANQQNLIIYFLVFGIILIVVMLLLALNRNMVKNKANKMLAERNKKIEQQKKEITDSIEAASRIQRAILPRSEYMGQIFGRNHFVFYRPRDIVSGDFYWISQQDGEKIFVTADCTGHGVPGAFMSVLGVSFLNEIVNIEEITKPGDILNSLRTKIINSMHQQIENDLKEGMDLSLITISEDNKKLQFAGANNSLLIVRNSELIELNADKMPVAIHYRMNDFKTHSFDLKKGDMIYMASDGYQDQIGGPNNKKFMKKRFKQLLIDISSAPLKEQYRLLNQTLVDWIAEYDQLDDIIVTGIKI